MLHHATQLQVRFYELDPYNHVNHAVYLSYFETARIQALESVGMGLERLESKGFRIVVAKIDVAFKNPVLAGETVTVDTEVHDVRRTSLHWHQEIHGPRGLAVAMDLRSALTDLDGKPVRIPDFFREAVCE